MINIDFFDSAQTPFSNCNIDLALGGRFIWTITPGAAALLGLGGLIAARRRRH